MQAVIENLKSLGRPRLIALGAVGLAPRGVYFGIWTPVTAILCAVGTLTPNRGIGLFLLGVVVVLFAQETRDEDLPE